MNLKPGGSGWDFKVSGLKWKGCYAYESKAYVGVYYGTGGTIEDMKAPLDRSSGSRYRPKGFECSVDGK